MMVLSDQASPWRESYFYRSRYVFLFHGMSAQNP